MTLQERVVGIEKDMQTWQQKRVEAIRMLVRLEAQRELLLEMIECDAPQKLRVAGD